MSRVLSSVQDLDAMAPGSVVMGFTVDDREQIVSRKSAVDGMWEQAGTDDGYQAFGLLDECGTLQLLWSPLD